MKIQTVGAFALALLLMHGGAVVAADAGKVNGAIFVENGQPRSVREIGDKWTSKEDALVCRGTDNFLVAGKALGAGDFRIRARLSLERLDGTAASLAFGQNHFGFDSRSGSLFVEGAALGNTRSVGNTADLLAPGRPFDAEIVRRGNTVAFRIDGKEVHRAVCRLDPPLAVALRPWRATMTVYDFSASGNLVDPTAASVARLRRNWKQSLHLTLAAGDIQRLPTREDLEAAERVEKTLLFEAGQDGYAVFRIPGIVVTTKGTVLAYCVGRKSPGDWADIDIFLRRSSDGGKTWEPPRKLGDVGASTVDNPTAIVDRKTGAVHMLYQVDYARAFYIKSDDDGRTFSEPVEITSVFEEFREEYDWNVIAPGPGHGIQLAGGRLIVPVWLSTGGRRHRPSIVSVIYSDDHGRTWRRGDVVVRTDDEFVNPSETVAVELVDGRVMLNIRNECPRHRRLVSFSADGATGWTKPVFDEALFEPICFGSIQRFSTKPGADKNRILFVNPNSGSRARRNLTVRLSYDEGRSWPVGKVLEPGIAGYSDLAVGPDGSIYCLYERGGLGGNHYHTQGVTVARFSLQWLTDGQDVDEQGERP